MLDTLPPVVQLILREPPKPSEISDLEQFRKYLKRLLPELRKQALWTVEHFHYPNDATDTTIQGFVIRPSTGLDPFSTFAKCAAPSCRQLNAHHVARSIGLYGDTVLMADRFTSAVLHTDRWTPNALFLLSVNILVLLTLRPMFEAGVFRFYRSDRVFCEYHRRQFFKQLDTATDAVLENVAGQIQYKLEKNMLVVDSGILHEPPLVFSTMQPKRLKARLKRGTRLETIGREVVRSMISDEVFESFLDLQNASRFKAVTFSNSRVSLLTAKFVERTAPSRENIEVWEASRSAILPWVRALTIPQIIQLREDAATALPRLRAVLASTMTDTNLDEKAIKGLINRLREDAEEVSAELKALKLPQREHDRTGLGLLGLTISIYGMAGDLPFQAAAVTGLVALLGLLHTTRRGDHQEHALLISRPGYVLLKAKELAEHAH
jgi:hypothetical protein